MNRESGVLASVEVIDGARVKNQPSPSLSQRADFGALYQPGIIDGPELARRMGLPKSWVASHTRARSTDPIPCLRFGRYVRFKWGSPELEKWIADHMELG